MIKKYVASGGTLLLFAQQYGSNIDKVVPIPEGESLHSYGWREDQSCFWGSAYHTTQNNVPHPIFSGVGGESVNVGVDGYFSTIPAEAKVLLRRKLNQEPVMISYPYGEGTVILTSLFSDYANAHSQMSGVDEAHIVRDLLTYARNVKREIPSWRLTGSGQAISISLPEVDIKNDNEVAAAKAKFRVLSPDYKRELFTVEQTISIEPQATGSTNLEFSITPAGLYETLVHDWIGIYHVEVELYDAAGSLIQPFTESDGGRFAIYLNQGKYQPGVGVLRWITVQQEERYLNQNVELDVHFRNTSDQMQIIDIPDPFFCVSHECSGGYPHIGSPIYLEIPAGEERVYHASIPMRTIFTWPEPQVNLIPISLRLQYIEAGGAYRQIGAAKVVFLRKSATRSSLSITGETYGVKNMSPINYSIVSNNWDSAAQGIAKIKLVMAKKTGYNSYQDLETILELEHDFTASESFQHSGQFVPSQVYTPGTYQLCLTVTTADDSVEKRYQEIYYVKSNTSLVLATIPEAIKNTPTYPTHYYLIPGQTYTVNFNLRNYSPFIINQGKYVVTLKSKDGIEVFRKEVDNIALAASQQLVVSEPFIFSPVAGGKYYLKVLYTDESRTAELVTTAQGTYDYMMKLDVNSEQAVYHSLDAANVIVKISAIGAIHIKLTDSSTGTIQERDINIPAGQFSATEVFPMQLGIGVIREFNDYKIVEIKITDSSGYAKTDYAWIFYAAPIISSVASTDTLGLKEGTPLNLSLAFNETSGMTVPLPATLAVDCAGLNFSDTQTVTIQPVLANTFNYQIPVAETVTAGLHAITYQLKIGTWVIAQGKVMADLPPIKIKFLEPPASVGAGSTFDLQMENSGGRPGTFALDISLDDEKGKQLLKHEEILTLTAGETKVIALTIPDGLKSGRYIITRKGTHEASGQVFKDSSGIVVSGLTATLNAYMLKEKYFDYETEAGKAEIVSGGNIVNSKLQAKIVKTNHGGSKVFKPGEYLQYAHDSVVAGNSYGDKTFFITETGLVELDRNSGKYEVLLSAYSLESIYITSSGELWLSTWGNGIFRRNQAGEWKNYTIDNGLLDNWVWSIIEREKDGQKSVWVATNSGISVFSNNVWSSYTTADGLTSNSIYQFAKDGDGEIWVYSTGYENAINRFNGNRFEKVNVPFDTSGGFNMGSSSNGEIWIISYAYDQDLNNWLSHVWRYVQGNWTNLDVSAISPTVVLQSFAEDDGEMWFIGINYETYDSVLIKFNGDFTVYDNTVIPEINSVQAIIPVPGWAGLYFNSNPGFIEFSAGQWKHHLIEIDENELPGPVTCIAGDKQGNIWTAGNGWISHKVGNSFIHYLSPQGDGMNWNGVSALAVGADGTAYAIVYLQQETFRANSTDYAEGSRFILKIAENGSSHIDCPDGLDSNATPVLAVDNIGRLWLVENPYSEGCFAGRVFYFDGEWHTLMDGSGEFYQAWANKIISDSSGGVYIAVKSDNGNAEARIIHVQNNLSIQEYTLGGPDFSYNVVKDIYLDSTGVLWILAQQVSEGIGEGVLTLQNEAVTIKANDSWDPTPGYPDRGLWGIGEEGEGNLVFAGTEATQEFEISHLYKLNQDGFTATNAAFYSTSNSDFNLSPLISDGNFVFTIGDIENSNMNYLLQIGAGLNKETIWSAEYPVNVNGGASVNIDLLPGKTLAAGNYILENELASAIDQKLAASQFGFLVRGSAVGASISRSESADVNVRLGSDATLQLEVLNNTAEDKANLNLKVSKVSPTGVEMVLQDGALSLNAGQSHAESLTFNESENGVWKLTVTVSEAGTMLDTAELLLDISAPVVTYEITQPEYAGDEAFPVKIRLANTGKIPTNMHISVGATGGSPSYLNEDITLAVGEERILSFNDTITADRVYDITFSGDLEASEQRTVQYGYVGNLVLTVLPQYREGTITMGYTVANAGGLPFSDTLHFGLYLMGTETALYTIDKTYNLYPGAEASADALEFALPPGAYQLRWTTGHGGTSQAEFSVLPSGIGQLAFVPAAKYPVGLTDFAYTLTNSDTVAGSIPLLIEIVPAAGGAAVYSLTRSHYLDAGASASDNFSFDFSQVGSYVIRISGAKVNGGTVSMPVKVLKLDEVTTSVAVQPASGGSIPVQVNIVNSGYNDFAGTLVIEAGGLRHEEQIQVLSEATLDQTFGFDANGLTSGSQEVIAYIYDAAGNVLSQNTLTVTVQNADIRVIEVPQNLTIAAGSFANATIKVKNEGNKRGEAEIAMTAFDNLNETRQVVLEAGEEKELANVFIDVDGDIPAGHYPFNYILSGLGVTNGLAKGNFNFQVTGIALNVSASLDRSLYNQGETAQLTIDVSSVDAVTAPLEAVVNWNDFSERRAFTLNSGSSSLVFEIPLSEVSAAKVFYGIYQEEGRGIYLNDIYLNFAGGVSVTLDQQVYDPNDSIHALFAVSEAGSLTAECFGSSQTVAIGSSAGVDFVVPADTLGGSYGVSWTFTPTNTAHEPSSGSKSFDVSGLVVKVAKAELERGKYAPGDTIKAMLTLESNRDVSLSLRAWTVTPEAQWTYLGEQSTTLSAAQQTPAVLEYAFATTEAGTHRFVYGLYRGEQLVVSGAAAFDCGDAVLIGLSPDHLEYANGNETVKVKADYFGSGTATLQLYLDDVVVDTKSITLSGLGSTDIDLTAAQVSGGRHDLRAVMTKDGLTSTRRAWFTYGTNLPDLAVGLAEQTVNGLDYVFTIRVENSGKTAAAATTVVFSDNDSDVQNAAIAALEPGAYQDAQFNWSGSGKAGSHTLRFAVDRENVIKEFAEANNVLEINEEVPALFYNLGIDPQVWTANRSVSIFSRFINNQAGDLPLLLHLTLTHNASSQVVLDRNKNITLVPFVQTVETDVFNTGTYPAGDYTLAQTASGNAIERTEELAVYIEPTKIISGTMTAVPTTVGAGVDAQVTLKLALSNGGNVALESEPLTIEVAWKESLEIVKTDALSISLALGESKTVDHVLALNLVEGVYTVTLKYLENTVAQIDITALKGLEKEKYVSRRPRMLIMNTLQLLYLSQKNYLKSILTAAGISYQDTANLIESYFHYQNGENNINVVFGNLLSSRLKKELKERVQRGEGLIYIADSAIPDDVMEELSGVKVRNLMLTLWEKEINLLPGLLGNGGAAVLKNKCKLRLEVLDDGVELVAETKNGKKPIMAYRQYGNGKVLTLCAPMEFTSGGSVFAQLLLNAVTLLNNETFSSSDLTRVMPMELRIKNNTGAAKTFRVQELIPQSASAYGFNPQPLAGDGFKWDLHLAVDEEKLISYWLRLPDVVGTYDIKSEIYEGEQKIDEALLTFEVGQKVSDRVVAIATEISAGGDAQAQMALPLLQNIAGRTGSDALSLWLNLNDAIKATDLVVASAASEAAQWRQKLQNVMLACARLFYEKAQMFSPLELSAFGTRFQE